MSENNCISLQKHKKIMLGILKDFVSFCEEHGLKYYLDAGTLLGAVRHKGFIPWDNDIDVCMMRPDYDRMIELLRENGGKLNDHIILEEPEQTIYCFCKLGDTRTKLIEYPDTWPEECYVYIDVFPKDGLQDLSFKTKALCKTSELLGLLHWFIKHSIPYWIAKKPGIKRWIAIIASLIIQDENLPYHLQQKIIKKYISRHSFKTCEYVTTLVNGEFNGCCKKQCWEESILLPFEDGQFTAPKGYALWMRILYGEDYMIPPPPENQRVHNVEAYLVEEKK